jgi:hypothetical protein
MTSNPGSHVQVARQAPGSQSPSPACPDGDADTSTGGRPAADASAEVLPESRTTTSSTRAAATPSRAPPEAPDPPGSVADERPDAPIPEADDGAAGSRSPSPAQSDSAVPPAPAVVAATSRETTERSPASGAPRSLTLSVNTQLTRRADSGHNRVFGTHTAQCGELHREQRRTSAAPRWSCSFSCVSS